MRVCLRTEKISQKFKISVSFKERECKCLQVSPNGNVMLVLAFDFVELITKLFSTLLDGEVEVYFTGRSG